MSKQERNKRYRETHKKEIKEYKIKYRNENKEEISKYQKEYYTKYYSLNKVKVKETHDKYRKANKEKIKILDKEYKRKRKNVDFLYKLSHNVRSLILCSIKSCNFKKNTRTTKILGCTIEEFKEYLEKQFESWMSWDNYGSYRLNGPRTWQIDHKIPSAKAKTEDEIIKLNHHTNLRPLCSKENLDKSNKML